MKPCVSILVFVALLVVLTACGSGEPRGKSAEAAADTGTAHGQGATSQAYDKNGREIVDFGHPATAGEADAIGAVATKYMRMAAAVDGKGACGLLYAILEEAVVEDYGTSPPGPPELRGRTCPQVMTKLFKRNAKRLASVLPGLRVAVVRVDRLRAYTLFNFGPAPPRHYLALHSERGVWKIDALLDRELG